MTVCKGCIEISAYIRRIGGDNEHGTAATEILHYVQDDNIVNWRRQ
jgi:hypothetical protein